MNNRDRDLLQDCLRALESGNSPEEILRHQPPETAARLRSLVEIAAVARGPAPAMPDPQARQRSRAAFLSTAAAPAPLPSRRRFALPGPIASLCATALALALAFAGLTAISRASLPGQMLYPLKRSLEQIEQRLNPQPTELQRRRLQEVQQLLALGITREVTFEGTLTNQTGDTWTVSGIPVLLTASTPIHGAPAVGRLLRVHGATGPNHLVLAFEITALAEAPAETPLPVLSPAPMQDTPPAPDPTPDPAPDPAPDLTRTGADLPGPTPDGRGNPAPTRPTRTPGGLPSPTAAPSGKPPRTPTPSRTPSPRPLPSATSPRTETAEPPETETTEPSPSGTTVPPTPTLTPTLAYTSTPEPEEVEFEGIVEQQNPGSWVIGGQMVPITARTVIEGNPQVGQRVKVKALRYQDGTLEALEIELEED